MWRGPNGRAFNHPAKEHPPPVGGEYPPRAVCADPHPGTPGGACRFESPHDSENRSRKHQHPHYDRSSDSALIGVSLEQTSGRYIIGQSICPMPRGDTWLAGSPSRPTTQPTRRRAVARRDEPSVWPVGMVRRGVPTQGPPDPQYYARLLFRWPCRRVRVAVWRVEHIELVEFASEKLLLGQPSLVFGNERRRQ